MIYEIEKFSAWLTNLNLHPNSPLLELQKLFKGWQRYKKVKYQNAREYDRMITDSWNTLKEEFSTDNGIDIKVNKSNEDDSTAITSTTPAKIQFKGNTEMKRLGIDISNFLENDGVVGRHLRKRKVSMENHEGDDAIAGGVLKARLNRVKLRTNVQNLRKSTRLRKK